MRGFGGKTFAPEGFAQPIAEFQTVALGGIKTRTADETPCRGHGHRIHAAVRPAILDAPDKGMGIAHRIRVRHARHH